MATYILTDSEEIELAALYRTNYLSQQQLADYFECSVPTVRKVLKAAGVTRQRTPITIPQARLLEYCQQHGITLLDIHRWNEGGLHAA